MDPGNWATDLAAGLRPRLPAAVGRASGEPHGDAAADPVGAPRHRQRARSRDLLPRVLPEAGSISLWVLAELGIVACDLAELIGVAVALHLLFGLPLVAGVLLASADAILILYLQDKGLCRLEAVGDRLIAVVAVCLGAVLLMAPPEGGALLRGFVRIGGSSQIRSCSISQSASSARR
jgi:manganese transport protein